MSEERIRTHIKLTDGKVFLPQSRMRQIRWEEAVLRSRIKREVITDTRFYYEGPPTINHWNCLCGSIECLGNPQNVTPRRRRKT